MTAAEEGVLLLCCALGDPHAQPLTAAQFRDLGRLIRSRGLSGDPLSQLTAARLRAFGVAPTLAEQILRLLDRQARLSAYLRTAADRGIYPLTRLNAAYPARLRAKAGFLSPPVLFCRGDSALFAKPSIAAVGSRRLRPENAAFARQAGTLAAQEGFTLVSGGAVGADQEAQSACLAHGGNAVIFPADALSSHPALEHVLYCSAGGYEYGFSTRRALARNGFIHMQGDRTLVAQCTPEMGGSWAGSVENLRHGYSDLFVFDDGSPGARALMARGATGVSRLESINALSPGQLRLL